MSIATLMERVDALSVELLEEEPASVGEGAPFTAGDLLSEEDVPGLWNIITYGCY